MSPETKTCQNCKQNFTIEAEDFGFYKKIEVPPPTLCPQCRLQRRLAWRNVRAIYKRKCDLCGKDKISIYSPDKPQVVYCSQCWWGDGWDPLQYGRSYDPNRSFFEQFKELMLVTPLVGRFGLENTALNSDYVNMFADIKDCYLCFHVDSCERCCYSYYIDHCKDCNGLAFGFDNELCYSSMALQQCNKLFYSKYSESCMDSWFLKNCSGCSSCFGSANLRGKQFYIFNEPYGSKEAYEKKLKQLGFNPSSHISIQAFKKRAMDHWQKYPSKYIHGLKNVNSTGEFVYNSKNSLSAFSVRNGENLKYAMFLVDKGGKESMDWTQYGDGGELIYEAMAAGGGSYNAHFGVAFWNGCKNAEYGWFNVNVSDCFGNVSIRNKKYCILNKQYSKEEYEALRKKIIEKMKADGEYGEFFPIAMSVFGYNETTAGEDFPLSEEDARTRGYHWTDIEKNKGRYVATMKADELPDAISDVTDDVTKQIIGCEKCSRVYRVVPTELNFHRAAQVPLPRLCVDCRYDELMAMRNRFRLYARKCQCQGAGSESGAYTNSIAHQHGVDACQNTFETSYSPDQSEIVYCETCYQAEVI